MDAITFFDIRNFSAHRQFLAKTKSGRPLSDLIRNLLEAAVTVSKTYVERFKLLEFPLLNHTGDGFVLVFLGGESCLAALHFASEFREIAEAEIEKYQLRLPQLRSVKMATLRMLPRLRYGMGVNGGAVTKLEFQGFTGKREIFLGSAVNVASRVEGCTKDHPFPVLCTNKVLEHAVASVDKRYASRFMKYFESIGLHNLRGLEGTVELYKCDPGLQTLRAFGVR